MQLSNWEGNLGLNRGIQGGNNSCYMDAILFGLFVATDQLDWQIKKLCSVSHTAEDRECAHACRLLASLVVGPLRRRLYVSRDQARPPANPTQTSASTIVHCCSECQRVDQRTCYLCICAMYMCYVPCAV